MNDHTADLLFNPFWNSHHTHGHGSQSFGMLNFEDAMSVEVVGESVPESPPPSYEEVERAERARMDEEDESGSSSSDSLV